MHNHHQFCPTRAGAYSATGQYQFPAEQVASQQQQVSPNSQWAVHQNQQQHHSNQHQSQQIEQQQQLYNQQYQAQYQQQQQQQYEQQSKGYAAINGFRYQLEGGQSHFANHCDTAASLAAYHLDHLDQRQQEQSFNNYSHFSTSAGHNTSNSSSPIAQQQKQELSAQTSAITQLQAFALTTPEAAAAAAAAVAFTSPYYQHQVSSSAANNSLASSQNQVATFNNSIGVIQNKSGGPVKVAKKAAARSKQPAASGAGSVNRKQGQQGEGALVASVSRSQRRYAGRASCDCPNCLDLEQQKRLAAGSGNGDLATGENNALELAARKLKHICHHAGCGKDYEKTSHLRAHLRWHTSERLSACRHPDCGKRFTRTDELRKHMKSHHSQQPGQSAAGDKQNKLNKGQPQPQAVVASRS